MYLLVMCNKDQYIHVLGAGLEKRFKPSLVCCAFETKSLPSKLCNYARLMFAHAHLYNQMYMCIVNIVGVFQISWGSVACCFCLIS